MHDSSILKYRLEGKSSTVLHGRCAISVLVDALTEMRCTLGWLGSWMLHSCIRREKSLNWVASSCPARCIDVRTNAWNASSQTHEMHSCRCWRSSRMTTKKRKKIKKKICSWLPRKKLERLQLANARALLITAFDFLRQLDNYPLCCSQLLNWFRYREKSTDNIGINSKPANAPWSILQMLQFIMDPCLLWPLWNLHRHIANLHSIPYEWTCWQSWMLHPTS